MKAKSTLIKFFILNAFMFLSCNMVHPVTPAFLKSLALPDFVFGLAFSAMSITNFLFSPFWGRLTDTIGRIRSIGFSLTGYALSQYLFMISNSEFMVILSRLTSGLFAGGFLVGCMAYLADITDDKHRAKYTAYYVAFGSVSASMGYLLGGFIGDYSIHATFITQVVFLLFSALMYRLLLKDEVVKPVKLNRQELIRSANPFLFFVQAKSIMTMPLFVFLITIFLTGVAISDYDNALNYYLTSDLEFPTSYNGIMKAVMGLIGLIANFTINQWLVKHTEGRKSIVAILMMCGILLLIASSTIGLIPFLLWNILFYTFNTMSLPIQQALIVEGQSDGSSNGLLYGIFNSVKSLGMIVGPLIAGFSYEIESILPFIIAGFVFFLSAGIAVVNYFQYKKPETSVK